MHAKPIFIGFIPTLATACSNDQSMPDPIAALTVPLVDAKPYYSGFLSNYSRLALTLGVSGLLCFIDRQTD